MLIFPVYILFLSIFINLYILLNFKENKKANLFLLNTVLLILFIHYFILFFYIKNFDILANFYIERFLVFLFIIFIILISFKKPENNQQSFKILIYLLAAIGIIFFNNIFVLIFSLILVKSIDFYSGKDEKTDFLNRNSYLFFIMFFLIGFLITCENGQIKKVFLNGIIISIIFFISIKLENIQNLRNDLHLFFLNGILYLIIFFKIIDKYVNFIIWQSLLFLLIFFLIVYIFHSLTEEIFKKFLVYDYLINLYFSYLFLFITEFKKFNFIVIILFFYVFLFNLFNFFKYIENDKITVSFVKYNLNKIKNATLIIFNLFISFMYNIFLIFQMEKYLLKSSFLRMVIIFIIIFLAIAILNKFFIIISMLKSIANANLFKIFKERQIYTMVFFLIFIFILICNLDFKAMG